MIKKIFFSVFILFFPFYVVASSDTEAIDKMHDCMSEEFNKCLSSEKECNTPCYNIGGGKCLDDCHLKTEECIDYSRRVEGRYKECEDKQKDFRNGISNEKDFCAAKIMFADCMDDFNGLCKVSWPRDCNNANNQTQNKNYKNQNNAYENLNNNLIGLPLNLSINAVPCIGETPKNSELCSNDDEKVFYYTQKELVESCSVPEGSEPKCEYACKSGYNFTKGECEGAGFFARILNWLGSLF